MSGHEVSPYRIAVLRQQFILLVMTVKPLYLSKTSRVELEGSKARFEDNYLGPFQYELLNGNSK